MGLKAGLVGLPNSGKSTLFNALTKAGALVADYPFSTIEANHGIVNVPDNRIDKIAHIINPKDIISATIEIVDIAGLIRGSSLGDGLGNKFLAHIREVDLIMLVIRCFNDNNISHVYETIDPIRDIDILITELCLADLAVLDRQIQNVKRNIANGLLEKREELNFLLRLRAQLNQAQPVSKLDIQEQKEISILHSLNLLTKKQILFVANIGEEELGSENTSKNINLIRQKTIDNNARIAIVSAKFESELTDFSSTDATEYLKMFGMSESGLIQLVQECYRSLSMITFFTYGEYGLRAWAAPSGITAPRAAGMIHTDMERGFIRIEVINCEDFFAIQSMDIARKKGLVRLEGKDYAINDGDIIYVRFKV